MERNIFFFFSLLFFGLRRSVNSRCGMNIQQRFLSFLALGSEKIGEEGNFFLLFSFLLRMSGKEKKSPFLPPFLRTSSGNSMRKVYGKNSRRKPLPFPFLPPSCGAMGVDIGKKGMFFSSWQKRHRGRKNISLSPSSSALPKRRSFLFFPFFHTVSIRLR